MRTHRKLTFVGIVGLFALVIVGMVLQDNGRSEAEFPTSELLRVTFPQEGTILEPGQALNVEVWVSEKASFSAVGVTFEGLGFGGLELKEEPPYEYGFTVPNDLVGIKRIRAFGVTSPGEGVFSEPVEVDIEPREVPTSLEKDHVSMKLRFAGQELPVRVTGKFSDGRELDLNYSTRIVFQSLDESIAIVSPTGMITGTGPGGTFIKIRYGELVRVLPVSVPKTIDGDLTGNKQVDEDDLNVIRSAFGSQGSAPATGAFDARDRNKDGVVDERDVELLRELCTNKDCSSRRSDE